MTNSNRVMTRPNVNQTTTYDMTNSNNDYPIVLTNLIS